MDTKVTNTGVKTGESPTLIVGVGASAGGLEAFRELLHGLADSRNLAIVYVQHQDPKGTGLLASLVSAATTMQVVEVKRRAKLATNTVYIAPPRGVLTMRNGAIRVVTEDEEKIEPNNKARVLCIDPFLHSLAEDQGACAVGIILSGGGSDGTVGLKAISDAGGLTFAQAPESARCDSMPRQAATTGAADHVLAPREMAAELDRYAEHMAALTAPARHKHSGAPIEEAIPRIADILLRETNHNFKHYKTSTLGRRIQRRMRVNKLTDANEYIALLEGEPGEKQALFRELLIGVTAFFRDPDAFDALAETVIPELFADCRANAPVRIWVPGCATGQEAYSIAMLCRERMDALERPPEVQIFATDIDERALQLARSGAYPIGIQDEISAERLQRFFVKHGKQYHITKNLREMVLFSSHNLIGDPPFSRLDLISCRNLLIYLGPHLQKKLIPLFHYALRPAGYLFLGPSENISSHRELFRLMDAKHRLSQRKGTAIASLRTLTLPEHRGSTGLATALSEPPNGDAADLQHVMQRIVLDEFAPKCVIVDEDRQILCASADMQKYLSVAGGHFKNNVIKLARSGLRAGLRAALNKAIDSRRRAVYDNLSVRVDGKVQRVMLTVQPMPQMGESAGLFMLVFQDAGLPLQPVDGTESIESSSREGVTQANADTIIAQLERELNATRDELERSMQEMETSHEELKSSNEELLSLNEELQSANEELETSKEEIQAGSNTLAQANSDLENLLHSTQIATIFLDDDYNIRSFTPAATQIYGLISTDMGRPLSHLMPLVDVMPAMPALAQVRADRPVEDTITTRSGKSFIRRVLPYRTSSGAYEGIVVTFTDITELHASQLELAKRERQLRTITDSIPAQVAYVDAQQRYRFVNAQYVREFGLPRQELLDQRVCDILGPENYPVVEPHLAKALAGEREHYELPLRVPGADTTQIKDVTYVPDVDADGNVQGCHVLVLDITQRKRWETELADREAHLRRVINNQLGLVAVIDKQGTLLEVDDRSLSIAGLTRDEVIGKHFVECGWWTYDDVVAQQMRGSMQRAFAGEVVRYDVALYAKGDARLMIDFLLRPVFDKAGSVEYLIASGVDISERKRTELALQKSEYRLQLGVEVAALGLAEVNYAANTISLSEKAAPMFGLGEEAVNVSRHKFHKTFHPDDRQNWINAIEKCLASGADNTMVGEYRIVLPDGAIRWLEVRKQVFFYADSTPSRRPSYAILVARDISDRKRSEQDLQAALRDYESSNAKLRGLFDLSVVLVGVLDLSGHLQEVNELATTGCGYSRDAGLGDLFWEGPWWSGSKRARRTVKALFDQAVAGETGRAELPYWIADGSRRLVEFSITPARNERGDIIFIVPSGIDITDRKRDERAIKLSEERLRVAAEAAGFGMLHVDFKQSTVTFSKEFKRLVGWPKDRKVELKPGEIPEFVHPKDRPAVEAYYQQIQLAPGSDIASNDHRIVRPDGEVRWVRLQTRTLFARKGDNAGQPSQIIGTLLDITAQRHFEKTLLDARRAAEVANQAKSAFLANISHEIRTPMSAVLGYTDLLAARETDPEKRDFLSTIKRNGQFLLDIINDILDLSKIEAGKLDVEREAFAPAKLVSDVLSTMNVRAHEKQLQLEVEYAGLIPEQILSDQKRLKQILVNLIGNAIKFTEIGSVRLLLRYHGGDQPQMQFDVIDTGIGMSAAQRRRLFQPFTQGDAGVNRTFGGTGLGLAISQRLAHSLGGEISVASKAGKGSTFSCVIAAGPLNDTALLAGPSAQAVESDPVLLTGFSLTCRVLVVDDRQDVRVMVKHVLEENDASVVLAEDGLDALAQVQAMLDGVTDSVDLILLDMQMPRLDGYQTAERLREIGFRGPIIALTADAMQSDMRLCLQSGCDAYHSKPIDLPALLALIDRLTKKVVFDALPGQRLSAAVEKRGEDQANGAALVLLVDDSVDTCRATQELLKLKDIDATVAHDGKSALETAKALQPRVIILDITLPDVSGYELVKSMQTIPALQDTLFIALSGHTAAQDERRALQAGFHHFLAKPADLRALLALIRTKID